MRESGLSESVCRKAIGKHLRMKPAVNWICSGIYSLANLTVVKEYVILKQTERSEMEAVYA